MLFLLVFIIISCHKQPVADFKYDSENYWTFEQIYFTNLSYESYYYEWDFGDSSFSSIFNPTHLYKEKGNYTITLVTISENRKKKDSISKDITIAQPTDLFVKTLFNNSPVDSCRIYLYDNYLDWKNQLYRIDSTITDIDGIGMFRNLVPNIYYIDAYKEFKNKTGYFSNKDTGSKTTFLIENAINPYTLHLIETKE